MKNILIPLFTLFATVSLFSQTMERKVVGASGGFVQTPAGSLHFTVGEMSISPRVSVGVYWGEGFQQTWTAPTVSTGDLQDKEAISFTVYPNPAADFLTVASDTPLQVQIFDLSGRAMGSLTPVNGTTELDLSHFPAGFYLLRAFDENGRMAGAAKVQHIR